MEMKRKFWLSSIIKNSFLLRRKVDVLANAGASNLRHKATVKSRGLIALYKDMEACGEYEDIQVMWEMIHSTCPSNVQKNNRRGKRI
ncbi:hypothetical protein BUALT_Bualt11G0133300 [Buddleja alternifolia]|uniref:Uncharacterized protein n=1 Tax=Buddleja alternifolia TaxID=168488 RepID=A0AAV6WVK2_9LAMI|nr:hypothetical protein BUALT_Bualt11G0133300 [Buddleja alternifolia]